MQDFVNGRCGWCGTDELYVKYHDQEWGNLVNIHCRSFLIENRLSIPFNP